MSPSVQQMLEALLSSGKMSPDLKAAVTAAMSDPAKLDELLSEMKALGADQIGSGPPLDIAQFYVEGTERYALRWPLPPNLLPIPFEELDRKTQFFVLFQEWTRRELDGMMLLNDGNATGAQEVFEECLERARQIDVAELEARSYEGMMRVAQRTGDRQAEAEWLRAAGSARSG